LIVRPTPRNRLANLIHTDTIDELVGILRPSGLKKPCPAWTLNAVNWVKAVVIRALFWSLPQRLVALVGGLVARSLSKMVQARPKPLIPSSRGAAA